MGVYRTGEQQRMRDWLPLWKRAERRNNLVPQKSPEPVTVKQMQSTTGGATGSRSGGGGSGGGLARFRSAPAAWLEALLEDEEEDLLRPNQCLTQLLAGNSSDLDSPADQALFEPNPSAGFQRQNSSPAEFLGASGIGEGFYSSYAINSSAALEISPTSKRGREVDAQNFPPKFSPQLKREGSGVSSLIDMEMEKLLEDSVPCRVRAKRGCATHPRSIAERVRRTRISDRIRKLQEVVPNMDKFLP
ncbi:Transcription factor bHLH80, partial [Cucurbita argyrosperma subsp. argyrosperma]